MPATKQSGKQSEGEEKTYYRNDAFALFLPTF